MVLAAIARVPWIGIALLVASVPAQDFGAITFGGQALTLTRAMFPLAVMGYVISLLVRRDRVIGTRLLVPYVLFVGVVVASTSWAGYLSEAAAEAGRWSIALVSFIILVHFITHASNRRLTVFVLVMALAGVFQATYGVTQSFLALGPESFRVGTQGSRAFGTFGQPNSYAGYLEMLFFPVFWLGMYQLSQLPDRLATYRRIRVNGFPPARDAWIKLVLDVVLTVVLLGSATLILGGIVASYSRGAWLGVAAGGVVTALLYHRRVRWAAVLLAPLAILVLLGGASTVLPSAINERITTGFADLRPFDASSVTITEDNFAAAERMAHWQAGWRMFDDHPVGGVGAGNFNVEYEEYFVREQFSFSRGHAHNYYIHVLAELGFPGIVAYISLAGATLYIAFITVKRSAPGFGRMIALGAFGTIVSVGVHNVFENLHVLNLSIQIGAVWALAIAAHRRLYLDPSSDVE